MFDKEYVKLVFQLYEEKRTASPVAVYLEKGNNRVHTIVQNLSNTGTSLNSSKRGRLRCTTKVEDEEILNHSKTNRNHSLKNTKYYSADGQAAELAVKRLMKITVYKIL